MGSPRPWVSAMLDVLVLGVLRSGAMHGYAISRQLADAGFGQVKGGTLYPLLARLEQDELVTHRWQQGDSGPPRKSYELTAAGRSHLATAAAQWEAHAPRVSRLLEVDVHAGMGQEG